MGNSITIIEKEILVLSVEIERKITIEISTGWSAQPNTRATMQIDITREDLDKIITNLTLVRDSLKNSITCEDCLNIEPEGSSECMACCKIFSDS